MKTSGHTVLITGGTGGIGQALIEGFIQRGNTVITADRNPHKQEALGKKFPGLHTVVCDLSKQEDLDRLVHRCETDFPEINLLINNAGVQYNYLFDQEPPQPKKIGLEMMINLNAPIILSSLLLPLLLQKNEAAIVNITSGLALTPKKSAAVYCASKAGLHSFSQSLRYQLEDTHIKVVEVLPPLVETSMTAGRGKGKITPQRLSEEFFRKFFQGKEEIHIGKSKLLKLLLRLAPKRAARILKNS